MNSKPHLERVARITSAWLDGLATDNEKSELNSLLKGDPEACDLYLDLVDTHVTLAVEMDSGFSVVPEPDSNVINFSSSPSKNTKYLPAMLVAASIMLLASLITFSGVFDKESEPLLEGGGIAVLSRLVNSDSVYTVGEVIESGVFSIEKGYAQLEFFCGSTVVIEGPARLDIESMWKATCHYGRLRASVPEPAQGFTIETANYRAVDLGTEFAMSVSREGTSEVHVLDGEVRLDRLDGESLTHLTTGMGVRSEPGDAFTELVSETSSFVGRERLQSLASDDSKGAYNNWSRRSADRRNDPSIVRLFDFEDHASWERKLIDRSTNASSAAIIGAEWTTGRWPEKSGIDFGKISDRIRLQIPGEFEALTLTTSIQIRSFDRWLSSLILTDGFEAGEIHWQISDEGEMILGIGEALPGINTFSPPVIAMSDLGRWIHIATTIDRASGTVVHYLNGEEVARETDKTLPPLTFGNSEIGNWHDQRSEHPIRSFNGKMDEFVIYQRALSSQEIKALALVAQP